MNINENETINEVQYIIDIFGPIDEKTAQYVISQLRYFDYSFNKRCVPTEDRVITVMINSGGGNVTDGLAIYDALNYINAKICTIAIGKAESMAALLLSAGTRGMRKATQNCEIMIHQPLGGVNGQASDIIRVAEHIKSVQRNLNNILSQNTGKSIQAIKSSTQYDKVMTASEALEFGIIDEVIPSPNKAKII